VTTDFAEPALNIDVQPDVWVTGPSVQLLVEAKGFRKGATFNVEQLPRELLCLQAHSGNRTPLLLLVLTTPPPIRLAGSGRRGRSARVGHGVVGSRNPAKNVDKAAFDH
jgi:hypothetical protein